MADQEQIDADTRRDWWHQSGAMNERGEFKQYLHIWTMKSSNPGPAHVGAHEAFPWIPLWDKPDVMDIAAYYHITNFAAMPSEWEGLWSIVASSRNAAMSTMQHGPYWMLLPQSSLAALAQQMTTMKRKIQNELFKKNKSQSITAINTELFAALEPLKVMTPQQEFEDEAVRSREIRSHNVQNRYFAALGRPPRCG